MPNWCWNRLTLKNTHQEINKLLLWINEWDEHCGGTGDGWHMLLDYFTDHDITVEQYNDHSYLGDARETWGTKWRPFEAYADPYEEGDGSITLSFQTAWSPPTLAYDVMKEQGWEVDAVYHEGGCQFAGRWVDGVEHYYEYDFSDPDWAKGMDEEVEEILYCEYEEWKEE